MQLEMGARTGNPPTTKTNDGGGGRVLPWPAVSGRYVRMFGTARGTACGYSLFEFEVYEAASAPTINTQPASQTVNAGATATFTVVAGGTGPFTYQWLKSGVSIPG